MFPKVNNNLLNTGSGANQLVVIDPTGKLPALDASQLLNFPASLGGGQVLLQTQVASSVALVTFGSTYITNAYKKYIFELIDIVPEIDVQTLRMVVSEDNGTNYKTGGSDYEFQGAHLASGGALSGQGQTNHAFINITGQGNQAGNAPGESACASIALYNPAGTTLNKRFFINTTMEDGVGTVQFYSMAAAYKGTNNAINNIKFSFSAGNIASGIFKLYGIQ